jgi:hypothetical protein
MLVRKTQEYTARLAPYFAEMLTSLAHRWRVNKRKKLVEMANQYRIEQCFVGVLQISQKRVALKVRTERTHHPEPALDLLIHGRDMRGEQSVQAENATLAVAEGHAFIQQGFVDEVVTGQARLDGRLRPCCRWITHDTRSPFITARHLITFRVTGSCAMQGYVGSSRVIRLCADVIPASAGMTGHLRDTLGHGYF